MSVETSLTTVTCDRCGRSYSPGVKSALCPHDPVTLEFDAHPFSAISGKKKDPPTEADLKVICELWQRRLRLCDWKIEIQYARAVEMMSGKGLDWGNVTFGPETRTAAIMILRPDDYGETKNGDRGRSEIEDTIRHELLHILIGCAVKSAAKSPDLAHLYEEQAVLAISEAFERITSKERVRDGEIGSVAGVSVE